MVYHDLVEGDLFTQVRQTIDLVRAEYLKAVISYEGIQRIETFPVPRAALREVILNALIHKNYAGNAPVQIRVYTDKLKIWNSALLLQGWTMEKLLGEHSSQPFNPIIANAFFRAGEIETWGQGIQRIFLACRAAGFPEPLIRYEANELWVEFPFSPVYLEAISAKDNGLKTTQKTPRKLPGKRLPGDRENLLPRKFWRPCGSILQPVAGKSPKCWGTLLKTA